MKVFAEWAFMPVLFLVAILLSPAVGAEELSPAPVKFQSALLLKLLAFQKDISNGSRPLVVHVIGNADLAAELEGNIGYAVGKGALKEVIASDDLPAQDVAVIYIGETKGVDRVLEYAKANKITTVSGMPDLLHRGVSIGFAVAQGKPKVFVNVEASKAAGVKWNPAILKIASLIE